MNFLHTAKRSALLAVCEAPSGLGVRPEFERTQTAWAGIVSGFTLDAFFEAKVEAFEHREGEDISYTEENIAKALVLPREFAPWPMEYSFSVDLFFMTDDPRGPLWVGWIEGEEVSVGPFDENGYATIIAMVDDGEVIVYGYDTELEWYVPVEGTNFSKFTTQPKSRNRS